MLIFGELPTKQQLEKLSDDIKERSIIDEDLRIILNSYPKSAHPMGILSSLTSGLVAFDPSAVDIDDDEDMYDAILNLLAKIPVLVAWVYRRRKGLPLEYGDTSLGYVENIARMMFRKPNKEYVANPIIDDALTKLLILHADHEQNCSTSTVRIVGSSHAGLFASVAAGISIGYLESSKDFFYVLPRSISNKGFLSIDSFDFK